MNKKIATLVLVGVMAIGSTVAAYAASNNTVLASATTASKAVTVEQAKEQPKEQAKENDEHELTAANTKTAITEEQAKQTALASVKDGVFKSIELEDEDGVIVYGVEIQSGTNTYDVKVDANTGSVVKTDQDNDKNEKSKVENESKDSDNDNIEHENQNEDPAGYED